MNYFKKVLILKQVNEGFSLNGKTASAICRIETDSFITSFNFSTINLCSLESGEYFVFILDSNNNLTMHNVGIKLSTFTLTLEDLPLLVKSISVGIVYVKNDIPTLILYCTDGEKAKAVQDFKKLVVERCILERKKNEKVEKVTEKVIEQPCLTQEKVNNNVVEKEPTSLEQTYNDEAVATENYFEQSFEEKLKIFEELDNEYLRTEFVNNNIERQEAEKKEQFNFEIFANEENSCDSQNYTEQNPYFNQAKKELEEIFVKFPKEEDLERCVPNSRWAKIYYKENKYYVVGVVKENKKEKYICYGVPSKYSPTPPKELDGFCSFIPLSVFDMKGDGYFMMFQDAVTGECVKINE